MIKKSGKMSTLMKRVKKPPSLNLSKVKLLKLIDESSEEFEIRHRRESETGSPDSMYEVGIIEADRGNIDTAKKLLEKAQKKWF